MALVKIGPKHQITIPKEVFRALHLEVGEFLEIKVENGNARLIPKKLIDKKPLPNLSAKEQRLLESAKKKIKAIQDDLKNSKGLTRAEAEIAAKAGLIDPEQMYWWLESWQEGEREAQRDIEAGRVSPAFDNADDAIAFLRREAESAK